MREYPLGDVFQAAWDKTPAVEREHLRRCLDRLAGIEKLGDVTAEQILLAIAMYLVDPIKAKRLTQKHEMARRTREVPVYLGQG